MSHGLVLLLGTGTLVFIVGGGIFWGTYIDPLFTNYLEHRRRLRRIRYAQLEETERRSIP